MREDTSIPITLTFLSTRILRKNLGMHSTWAGLGYLGEDKREEITPEGFEIRRAPEIYRVEDRYLDMKGKRLKTEEIRLVLRSATKGTSTSKPRIMYLDETRRYKSHEPRPAIVVESSDAGGAAGPLEDGRWDTLIQSVGYVLGSSIIPCKAAIGDHNPKHTNHQKQAHQ